MTAGSSTTPDLVYVVLEQQVDLIFRKGAIGPIAANAARPLANAVLVNAVLVNTGAPIFVDLQLGGEAVDVHLRPFAEP